MPAINKFYTFYLALLIANANAAVYASTAATEAEASVTASDTANQSQALEKLVQDALNAKPSLAKKIGLDSARVTAKIIATVGGLVISILAEDVYNHFIHPPSYNLHENKLIRDERSIEPIDIVIAAIAILSQLTPPLIDGVSMLPSSVLPNKIFNLTADQTLKSLLALKKYISTLTPEQKNQISAEFKEKYAAILADKLKQEKTNAVGKIATSAFATLDIGLPIIWLFFVAVLFGRKRNDKDITDTCLTLKEFFTFDFSNKHKNMAPLENAVFGICAYSILFNCLQNIAKTGWNLYKNSNAEKLKMLADIEKALEG